MSRPSPVAPAGIVRASSVFPILSTVLLMLGGLCVGVGRVYNKTNNVLLSAGILFVAAGESRSQRLFESSSGFIMKRKKAASSGACDNVWHSVKVDAIMQMNFIPQR